MGGETVGEALNRWRNQHRLSLRELGKRLNYSHVYIWEIEKGLKVPPATLIAKCDELLGAGGQLIAAAARHRSRVGADVPDNGLGLQFGSDWTGSVETVTTLWRHDAGRRALLRSTVFASAAITAPVNAWLSFLDADAPTHDERADLPSPAAVREMTQTFRRLDNLFGSGELRSVVVRYLDANVTPLLQSSRPDTLGRGLLSAVAEMTQLAGWLAYDECDHGAGQRYFVQALDLARWAGDRALGAEILAGMSHQAIFLRQPKPAIALAEAAYRTARNGHVPALMAEATVTKAHAHAIAGSETACSAALGEAETMLEQADRTADPQWMSYFDEAYLAAITGHCFRALGKSKQAEQAARRSLEMKPGYVRGRVFNQLLLAGTHALGRDIEQACATGHEALNLANELSSTRAVAYVDRLVGDLQPWSKDHRVREFTERARLITA